MPANKVGKKGFLFSDAAALKLKQIFCCCFFFLIKDAKSQIKGCPFRLNCPHFCYFGCCTNFLDQSQGAFRHFQECCREIYDSLVSFQMKTQLETDMHVLKKAIPFSRFYSNFNRQLAHRQQCEKFKSGFSSASWMFLLLKCSRIFDKKKTPKVKQKTPWFG